MQEGTTSTAQTSGSRPDVAARTSQAQPGPAECSPPRCNWPVVCRRRQPLPPHLGCYQGHRRRARGQRPALTQIGPRSGQSRRHQPPGHSAAPLPTVAPPRPLPAGLRKPRRQVDRRRPRCTTTIEEPPAPPSARRVEAAPRRRHRTDNARRPTPTAAAERAGGERAERGRA